MVSLPLFPPDRSEKAEGSAEAGKQTQEDPPLPSTEAEALGLWGSHRDSRCPVPGAMCQEAAATVELLLERPAVWLSASYVLFLALHWSQKFCKAQTPCNKSLSSEPSKSGFCYLGHHVPQARLIYRGLEEERDVT